MQNEGWICLRDEARDTSTSSELPNTKSTLPAPSAAQWVVDADDWGDDTDNWGEDEKDTPLGNNEVNMEAIHSSVQRLSMEEVHSKLQASECSSERSASPEDQFAPILPTAEVEEMEASVTVDDVSIKPSINLRSLFSPSETALKDTSHLTFHSFYLSVIEEQSPKSSTNAKLDERAKQLMLEYQEREKCDLNKPHSLKQGPPGMGEVYEKARPTHGDEAIHKFISRVQAYPEQLIRYERGGVPLPYKTLRKIQENCKHCGSTLVFELQLMPHLSQKLSLHDEKTNDCPIEIGTVLIFTCSKSCWSSDSLREELVIVQAELY